MAGRPGAAFNGFQAVILTESQDQRLYPLTENESCKSLLKVANIPILEHQLRLVESAGFTEVVVVAEQPAMAHVQRAATAVNGVTCHFREVEEDSGTADMLRQLTDIKSDLLVICPDVITNCALHDLVDLHRLRGASATCLVTAKMEPRDAAVDTKKKDRMEERDVIGLDSSTQWGTVFDEDQAHQRLLYMATADEINEGLQVRSSMVRRCPSITLHTGLLDSTVYVLAPWVLKVLQEGEAGSNFRSIKDELVPFLIRHQHRSSLGRIPAEAKEARERALLHVHHMTSVLPATSSCTQLEATDDVVQCYVLVPSHGVEGQEIFCMKASSVSNYLELNREVAYRRIHQASALYPQAAEHECPHRSERKKFDADTLVGEGTAVGDKTTIKKSVIGTRCVIGAGVKIASCVIMDNVKISDGVKLENCVVCSGAELLSGVQLTTCRVAYNYQVPADTHLKNEQLCAEDYDYED